MRPIVDEHVVMQSPELEPKKGLPITRADMVAAGEIDVPPSQEQSVFDVVIDGGMRVTAETWPSTPTMPDAYGATIRAADGEIGFQSNRCSSPVIAVQAANAAVAALRMVMSTRRPRPTPITDAPGYGLKMGLTWEERARALWQILDDVDTMSDMFKDDARHGRDTCVRVQQRHEYLVSDGYSLFTPEEAARRKPSEWEASGPQAPPPEEPPKGESK